LDKIHPADTVGETEVVFDVSCQRELAARLVTLEDEGIEVGPCSVDCR
jgi:hypothetical protein